MYNSQDIAKRIKDTAKSKNIPLKEMFKSLKISDNTLHNMQGSFPKSDTLARIADNVHLDEHYLTGGKKTEKGKRRKIIIPDKLVPVIRSMLSQSSGKLCRFSNADAFYKTWIKKRASLGLRECLVPYCARHTYVTRCTALGISPAMLKELVGHEDYETTLAYTHLSVADRLDAVNRL